MYKGKHRAQPDSEPTSVDVVITEVLAEEDAPGTGDAE